MGAEDRSFVVRGGNEKHVKDMVEKACDNDKYECGHGGYTGSWAEWNGGLDFHTSTIFKTQSLAYEYLFGKFSGKGKKQTYTKGVVDKWENAIAVKFRNDKGQVVWLVGACFSC